MKIYLTLIIPLIVFSLIYIFSNYSPGNQKKIVASGYELKTTQEKEVFLPRLVGDEKPPEITAKSVVVFDEGSKEVLFEKNPNIKMYPASTTKMMTSLVAMDYYPLDRILTVDNVKVEGQRMDLEEGERMKVGSLLYGLLVYSANDAAEVLARNYPGGRENFILAMNLKVSQLGLSNTSFSNPTGLDDEKQYTTAYELVEIARHALNNPQFAEIVSTQKTSVKDVSGNIIHRLSNLNELLGNVDGVLGVKTGWTENAKENLVTYIERDDKRVFVSLLSSNDRFGETSALIDWIFRNYQWESTRI